VRAPAAILSACAAIATGGCSQDHKPVRTLTVDPGATVQMAADEYRFDPGRIVVRARGGNARLRIVLANHGTLAHDLQVRVGQRDLAETKSFRPGGKRPVNLTLQPGRYDFRCTVADHDEKGMVGKLEVR